MADISTVWDAAAGRGDWALPAPVFSFAADANGHPIIGADGFAIASKVPGDEPGAGLSAGRDIETAVLISLHTDAAAGPDDQIVDGSADPRGWWGDGTMGSKLWLLARAKQTAQTALLAKTYAEQALAWLLSDGAAASVAITAEWVGRGVLGLLIVVTQPDGTVARVATQYAWKDL